MLSERLVLNTSLILLLVVGATTAAGSRSRLPRRQIVARAPSVGCKEITRGTGGHTHVLFDVDNIQRDYYLVWVCHPNIVFSLSVRCHVHHWATTGCRFCPIGRSQPKIQHR